ncbi:MAG: hypothetical protein N2258_00825 [Brevinematales bacterium]|nr:hypothetical protein [Brevinematales bacterium]
MKKFLFLIFFFSYSFGLELSETSTNQVANTNLTAETIVFEHYDEIELQNFDSNNVRILKFIGNVKVKFQGKNLKSRLLTVTLIGNKVKELSAFENVEFKDNDSIYLANKFYFDPDKKIGVLYNVRSFLKDTVRGGGPISTSRGTFFEAKKITILSEKKIILEDVYFTFTHIEPPPYRIFSKKVWYFKDEILFALFDAYYVGQAIFLPIPFYFRWDKFSGMRTAFGQEKRIGWYLMNTFDFSFDYGNSMVYLDFYEKLGQYTMISFRNSKEIEPFKILNAKFYGANDQRVYYDAKNDRYTKNLPLEDGSYTNISQLSWNYQLNTSLSKNNLNIDLYWEDLNDPYFKHKFSSRRETFDIRQILQPEENSFYGARRGSLDTTALGYSRNFSIQYYNFSLKGDWSYSVKENSEFNKYLTDRYSYYLSSSRLPQISFSLPSTEVFSSEYKIIKTNITTNSNNSTNIINTTENFSLYTFKATVNGNFNYDSLENYDTNQVVTSDKFSHRESGSLGGGGNILGDLISYNANFNFENTKYWSTFPTVNSNYMKSSGYFLGHTSGISLSKNFKTFEEQWFQFSFPLSISHNFSYDIATSIPDRMLYSSHNTSVGFGIGILSEQFLNKLNLSHYIKYRLTNIEQNDIYIDNIIERNLDLSYRGDFFKFYNAYIVGISISTRLNILETKTNDESTRVKWSYPEITNRIISGYNPKLSLTFSPPSQFNPLPRITYSYDILRKTNEYYKLESSYSLANIYDFIFYRIEVLNLNSSLYWDYLNPRKDLFNLNFNTTIWFDPTWKLSFNTYVINKNIHRYLKDYNPPDKDYLNVDFWENLLDGLKIYDYNALKRSYFKVQQLSFNLTHYILEEWELNIAFNITRRTDTTKLIAYWEPSILITFVLRGTSEQFPPYQKTFLPENYQ